MIFYTQKSMVMKKFIFSLIIILAMFFTEKSFATYKITPFNFDWCSSTYPSTYEFASFSIAETSNNGSEGFTKSQTNATLWVDLPDNFEFKTVGSIGTVTSSSPEVTIVGFSFPTTKRIQVIITTNATNIILDAIYFDKFEIRALITNQTGTIKRLGGTFKIDNSAAVPPSTVSWGQLTSKTPFVYTSSQVWQISTADINQYSLNTQILRIRISGTGSCSGVITRFTFNTDGLNGTGTDADSNIMLAKVYYTRGSSTFSPLTFFGSYPYPKGEFTIEGSQNCDISGNNYFWLVYDVPGDANTNPLKNKMDASLTSFVLQGNVITNMLTPAPIGYRKVIPNEFYYSISDGYFDDYHWSATDGGPSCNCSPNGAGIAVIKGNDIVAKKSVTVDVVKIEDGGLLRGASANVKVTVMTDLTTYGTGIFFFNGDITVKGNVNLFGTGISEFHKVDTVAGSLYVGPNASYQNSASSTYDLAIGGNLKVDGYLQNTQAKINMYGGFSLIDGKGRIKTDQFVIKEGDKDVIDTTDLYMDAAFEIQGPYIVDNFGKMNIRGNMTATDASAKWINESNSVLSYGGSANMFASLGSLDATADYNTVTYSGLTMQNIIDPKNSVYYHLNIEGTGPKTMIAINNLHGDFGCYTSFGHGSKEMIVNGNVMQYFKGTTSPTMNKLTMSNSAAGGGLTLQLPVYYSGILTLNNGKIFTNSTNLLIANDNALATSGSENSFVHGPMKKKGNDIFTFPIGKNNKWARLGISAPLTVTSEFVAEYFDSPYASLTPVTAPLDHVSSMEYWNLTNPAKASDPITVKLFWEDASFSGISDYSSNLVVAGWSGGSWVDRGQSAITGADPGNVTSSVFSSFGPVTFGDSRRNGNPLPVKLLSFVATCNDINVSTKWTTATETNNDYFTLENSTDAKNWHFVANIKGSGNSNEIREYQYTDATPANGISYYRLWQTDFDGRNEVFSPVSVSCSSVGSEDFSIFPNPSKGEFNINYVLMEESTATIKVFNMLGNLVFTDNIIAGKGPLYRLDLRNQSNGMYYVVLSSGNTNHHQKILKE